MPSYVEVSVNVPQARGAFHYHLPEDLEGRVQPGHLVEVPFGHQMVQGVVIRFVERPSVPQTKPIVCLIDDDVVLTHTQIMLAEELAEITLSPLSACIDVMIPSGLGQMADSLYSLGSRHMATGGQPLTAPQNRLLGLIDQRGPLRGRQIDRLLTHIDWRLTANALVRRGLLERSSVLPQPTVKPKHIRTAQLAISPEKALSLLSELGRAGSPALGRRQSIVRLLIQEPRPIDVAWIYAESGGTPPDIKYLAERGILQLGEDETWRDPLSKYEYIPTEPPRLTQDQLSVWNEIQKGIRAAALGEAIRPYLLHGVTGSGKTEIYLQGVAETLTLGRGAIVLVPEIALTPQTVRRFLARFPGQVGLVHSQLSPGERYDTWRRARAGMLNVIVGPRSALFTPLQNVGLIVVDEFHDDSYYQSEMPPYYHTREAAISYARLAGAACILGSATPDVVSQYHAIQGKWYYLSLPARILAHQEAVQSQLEKLKILHPSDKRPLQSIYHPFEEEAQFSELPQVKIVDMRYELKEGNRSIFSRALLSALETTLGQDQQAILFLNRRGTATFVFCRDCGHTLKCPRCEIPLTLHTPQITLTCHYCGYKRNLPKSCPNCHSNHIRHYGTGTERVEAEVQAQFPTARTIRWDFESTRQKGGHDLILNHFINRQADILIGTQMVAKGLDLPLVTLVGVILADVGLSLPDYHAAERVFQVLTQVAGRAGRSPLGGKVILQTFQPDHYAIQAASQHNYQSFYQQELRFRRQLGYPPYRRLVRLLFTHNHLEQAEEAAQKLAHLLNEWISVEERSATEIIGPAPCFFTRIAGRYRWQIILRGPEPASLLRGRSLPVDWQIELDPPSLL